MDDETPSRAVLNIVRDFARDLEGLRHESEARSKSLRQEVDAALTSFRKEVDDALTAVRHDVYSSVLILDQRMVELAKTVDQERDEAREWRADERSGRINGVRQRRTIDIIMAAALIAVFVVVLLR
jgi:hypothetical protein